MSKYTNQANVGIGEMGRLIFNDVKPTGETEIIAELVMHPEMMKVLRATLDKTINDHEKALADQKEANKGMN